MTTIVTNFATTMYEYTFGWQTVSISDVKYTSKGTYLYNNIINLLQTRLPDTNNLVGI